MKIIPNYVSKVTVTANRKYPAHGPTKHCLKWCILPSQKKCIWYWNFSKWRWLWKLVETVLFLFCFLLFIFVFYNDLFYTYIFVIQVHIHTSWIYKTIRKLSETISNIHTMVHCIIPTNIKIGQNKLWKRIHLLSTKRFYLLLSQVKWLSKKQVSLLVNCDFCPSVIISILKSREKLLSIAYNRSTLLERNFW